MAPQKCPKAEEKKRTTKVETAAIPPERIENGDLLGGKTGH